jgi:hypothetical protein
LKVRHSAICKAEIVIPHTKSPGQKTPRTGARTLPGQKAPRTRRREERKGKQVEKKREEISKMILDYLRKNPDAGDTLEGISRWWLNCKVDSSVDEVSDTLEILIKEGFLKKQMINGDNPIYKICKKDYSGGETRSTSKK